MLKYFKFLCTFTFNQSLSHGPSRQKVSLKLDINAPASEVWKIVSNFRESLGTKRSKNQNLMAIKLVRKEVPSKWIKS